MVDRPSKNTNVARECAQLSLKFLCIKKNIEEDLKKHAVENLIWYIYLYIKKKVNLFFNDV